MAAKNSEESLSILILYLEMKQEYNSVLRRLKDYQNVAAAVDDVSYMLEECAAFPTVYPSIKSGCKSISDRLTGDEYASKKNYPAALQYYNKAIASAFPKSEELGMAYASRSEVLMTQRKYEKCITDINRAYKLIKDEKLKDLLIDRYRSLIGANGPKRKATDYDKAKSTLFSFPKKSHSKIPCAQESLKLVNTVSMGRGVFATKDITIGETIAIEKPYVPILVRSHYLQRCYNCLELNENMIPCDGCDHVMFCDEKCSDLSYHNLECPIMSYLVKSKTQEDDLIALRTILKARTEFPTIDLMEKRTIKTGLKNRPYERGFVVKSSKESIYDSQYYDSVNSLDMNMIYKTPEEKLEAMVRACVLLHILKYYTKVFDGWIDEYCSKHVWWNYTGELLYRNILNAVNKKDIETIVLTSSKKYISNDVFGVGVYPFIGILNHSCAPNTRRVCDGTKMVLFSVTRIKKGQQIFDCYWKPFTDADKNTRQEYLKKHYYFDCTCEACTGDWDVFQELPDPVLSVYNRKVFNTIGFQDAYEDMQRYNKRIVFRILEKLYKNLQILNNYKPSHKLVLYEKLTEHCWALFGNVAQFDDYFIKMPDIPNSTDRTTTLFHTFSRMING